MFPAGDKLEAGTKANEARGVVGIRASQPEMKRAAGEAQNVGHLLQHDSYREGRAH